MLKGDVVGPPADIWSVGVLTFIMWVLLSQLPWSKLSLNRNVIVPLYVKCDLMYSTTHLNLKFYWDFLVIWCNFTWVAALIAVWFTINPKNIFIFSRLSGRLPFSESDPQETEARIQAAKFDLSKLYQNVSQSASLFLKKILCSYPW